MISDVVYFYERTDVVLQTIHFLVRAVFYKGETFVRKNVRCFVVLFCCYVKKN